ncbi:histidinol-phosphate aminotransferase [Alicyclobacillus hesperidum URH17-3-68]|nr:histidinol-phosphate aminotransferase [Alicyclobacillus hesperidum URH17-3-68]
MQKRESPEIAFGHFEDESASSHLQLSLGVQSFIRLASNRTTSDNTTIGENGFDTNTSAIRPRQWLLCIICCSFSSAKFG